jgi:nucleoid-associated protein YgaU
MAGPLAKAAIVNLETNEQIDVMYNPEELRLEQANTFAEIGIPGLAVPPVQYVRGRARTLSMDLFFDTYEERLPGLLPGQRADVRLFSGRFVRLLDQDARTKAPPNLLFSLGQFQFQCVLVEASQRFTMFWSDGTPVRATISARFQEVRRIDFIAPPGFVAGPPTTHTISSRDTLSGLAYLYLGNPARWRMIAEANGIDDPLRLPSGMTLVVPNAGRPPRPEPR